MMPKAFASSMTEAQESLSRIEGIDAGLVLPGHGDPWTDGVATLVARAREASLS
jgi:hypothetical protein